MRWGRRPPIYHYSPRFVPWLRAHRHEYDVVIVNGLWQYASFGVWRALHGTPTPYFVFTHGMLDPWFKRRYPPDEALEEMAVLAVGRVPRVARLDGGAVHLRRGAAARPAILLALPGRRIRGELRDPFAHRRSGRATRVVPRPVCASARQALPAVPRARAREKRSGPVVSRLRRAARPAFLRPATRSSPGHGPAPTTMPSAAK